MSKVRLAHAFPAGQILLPFDFFEAAPPFRKYVKPFGVEFAFIFLRPFIGGLDIWFASDPREIAIVYPFL